MSEMESKAGIAIKLPFFNKAEELINWLAERNITIKQTEVEEEDGEIVYIDVCEKDFEIARGENGFYLEILFAPRDREGCGDIEVLISQNKMEEKMVKFNLKIMDKDDGGQFYDGKNFLEWRFFAHNWYNGVDAPEAYWKW